MKINKYTSGIIAQLRAIPKWTKIGIVGVVLMYTAVAGMTSAAIPWWISKGDSALHIDYVLSVYQGDIPKYHDFVQYPVFHKLNKGYKTQIQRAAANPPLFYLMHAPIVGPSLASGHWKQATGLGRAFNVFLGVLTVLALAWAGWLFGGKQKELFAVAVPAVGTMSYQFTNLNQNYALDVLLVFLGVLTTIVWYKLIKHGLEKRYVASLILLSILGMSTKASYVIFLGISFLTVMIAALMYTKGSKLRKFFTGSIISGLILTAVLVCIGWFYYYWNYKTSGNWFDAELPGDFGSRVPKSLSTVLTHSGLWGSFYERFTSHEFLSKLITFVAAAGIALAVVRTKLRELTRDRPLLISIILLVLLLMSTTATQITHSVGIGNFSFRYFLPALLVFSLFFSYGLLEIKRTRGQLVSLAVAAMATTSIITLAKLDNTETFVPAVGATNNIVEKLDIAMRSNGFPETVLVFLLAMVVTGIVTTAASLFVLSKSAKS